jgi:hypothetical protein
MSSILQGSATLVMMVVVVMVKAEERAKEEREQVGSVKGDSPHVKGETESVRIVAFEEANTREA